MVQGYGGIWTLDPEAQPALDQVVDAFLRAVAVSHAGPVRAVAGSSAGSGGITVSGSTDGPLLRSTALPSQRAGCVDPL